MVLRSRRAWLRSLVGRLAPVGLTGAVATAMAGAPEGGASALRSYIVRLDDPPLLAYAGGIGSLAPTRPEPGQPFDATSPASLAYAAHLERRQAAVLAALGDVRPLHRYTVATNGFAIRLDDAQASRLRRMPGVSAVDIDGANRVDPPPPIR